MTAVDTHYLSRLWKRKAGFCCLLFGASLWAPGRRGGSSTWCLQEHLGHSNTTVRRPKAFFFSFFFPHFFLMLIIASARSYNFLKLFYFILFFFKNSDIKNTVRITTTEIKLDLKWNFLFLTVKFCKITGLLPMKVLVLILFHCSKMQF